MARPKTLRPADFAVMTTTAVLLNVRHDLATPAPPAGPIADRHKLDGEPQSIAVAAALGNQLPVLLVEMEKPFQLGPRQHPVLAVPRHHTLITHSRS